MTASALIEFEVRQLQARYGDAVWRRDVKAFVDCFAAAGEWKIAGHHLVGREAIAEQFPNFMAPSERVLMLTGTPLVTVSAEGVSARTPATELIKLRDGRGVRTLGIYYDQAVEEAGRWRFRRRHWALHYYGAPDMSDPLQPSPDYGPPPGMPADDEPTIVRTQATR